MFGEIPLKGEEIVTVKNNSIKLPKFTLAEQGEGLCFLFLGDEIRLYSDKEYHIFLKEMYDYCKKENFDTIETDNVKRYICAKGCEVRKVNQGRIKSLKFLRDNFELMFVGAGNHAKILTKEQYRLLKK